MFIDQAFNFASAQAIGPANTDVLSTNVFDASAAKKLFGGTAGKGPKVHCTVSAIGGTTPNIRARLVGADNAALTTNPVILADSGVSRTIVAGDLPFSIVLYPSAQLDKKRYYGVIFTQGGNADNTATVSANGVIDGQDDLTGNPP